MNGERTTDILTRHGLGDLMVQSGSLKLDWHGEAEKGKIMRMSPIVISLDLLGSGESCLLPKPRIGFKHQGTKAQRVSGNPISAPHRLGGGATNDGRVKTSCRLGVFPSCSLCLRVSNPDSGSTEVALTRLPCLLECGMTRMGTFVIACVPLHVMQRGHRREAEAAAQSRRRTRGGRPPGDEVFISRLEFHTGRILRPRPGPRPQKGQSALNLG
jgi:hypothetical protein